MLHHAADIRTLKPTRTIFLSHTMTDLFEMLPNELVEEVVSYDLSTHTDLPSLCQTCKRMRQIAVPRLYQDVEINSSVRMHRFLRSVLRDRTLGGFVRSLELDWSPQIDYGLEQLEDEGWRDTSELEEVYQAALEFGLDRTAFDNVKAGSETAAALILLCSLPNVVVLDINLPENDRVIESFNARLDTRFLTKVETVRISSQYDYEGGYPVCTLIPFIILPSIRTISARMVYAEDRPGESTIDLERHFGTSSVERLELTFSNIEAAILPDLLKIPRSLKVFKYDRSISMGAAYSSMDTSPKPS